MFPLLEQEAVESVHSPSEQEKKAATVVHFLSEEMVVEVLSPQDSPLDIRKRYRMLHPQDSVVHIFHNKP